MGINKKHVKSYTLIEVIISILLVLLIFSALLFSLQFVHNTYHNIFSTSSTQDNLRHLSIVLERQILSSETLYIVNNVYYIKDLETSQYYNYYYCDKGILYKVKTNNELVSIGYGSVSQMADNIKGYSINYSNGWIQLTLESNNGEEYVTTKEIPYGGKVIVINSNFGDY